MSAPRDREIRVRLTQEERDQLFRDAATEQIRTGAPVSASEILRKAWRNWRHGRPLA